MNERTTKCVIKENNMRPPLKTTDIYFWNVSPCMNICRCNALPILYLRGKSLSDHFKSTLARLTQN